MSAEFEGWRVHCNRAGCTTPYLFIDDMGPNAADDGDLYVHIQVTLGWTGAERGDEYLDYCPKCSAAMDEEERQAQRLKDSGVLLTAEGDVLDRPLFDVGSGGVS